MVRNPSEYKLIKDEDDNLFRMHPELTLPDGFTEVLETFGRSVYTEEGKLLPMFCALKRYKPPKGSKYPMYCENGHSIFSDESINFDGNCLCGAPIKEFERKFVGGHSSNLGKDVEMYLNFSGDRNYATLLKFGESRKKISATLRGLADLIDSEEEQGL